MADPWAHTVPYERSARGELPPLRWTPGLPVGEATELPHDDGMRLFRLAEALREQTPLFQKD